MSSWRENVRERSRYYQGIPIRRRKARMCLPRCEVAPLAASSTVPGICEMQSPGAPSVFPARYIRGLGRFHCTHCGSRFRPKSNHCSHSVWQSINQANDRSQDMIYDMIRCDTVRVHAYTCPSHQHARYFRACMERPMIHPRRGSSTIPHRQPQ